MVGFLHSSTIRRNETFKSRFLYLCRKKMMSSTSFYGSICFIGSKKPYIGNKFFAHFTICIYLMFKNAIYYIHTYFTYQLSDTRSACFRPDTVDLRFVYKFIYWNVAFMIYTDHFLCLLPSFKRCVLCIQRRRQEIEAH